MKAADPGLCFIKQTIGNACGTIGLLHALCNNMSDLTILPQGPFDQLYQSLKDRSPDERAQVLEQSKALAQIHQENSEQGQTQVALLI